MAENGFQFDCDLQQGFNFKADVTLPVMHIKKFKIGEKEFKADLTKIADPTDPSKELELVGVGTGFSWDAKKTGSLSFWFNLSNASKVDIVGLTKSEMKKTTVEIEFSIYAFDDAVDQKKWYVALGTGDDVITGAISKSGSYDIYIDDQKDPTVPIPPNYRFSITLDPDQAKQQALMAAFAVGNNQAFKWGVENA
jgi:hypothetical protein